MKRRNKTMNKYFVIGLITAFVGFGIYDIKKTIEVKREIERNKKLRQRKYEQRLRLKDLRKFVQSLEEQNG